MRTAAQPAAADDAPRRRRCQSCGRTAWPPAVASAQGPWHRGCRSIGAWAHRTMGVRRPTLPTSWTHALAKFCGKRNCSQYRRALTRMKSLPSPWYLRNSTLEAAACTRTLARREGAAAPQPALRQCREILEAADMAIANKPVCCARCSPRRSVWAQMEMEMFVINSTKPATDQVW